MWLAALGAFYLTALLWLVWTVLVAPCRDDLPRVGN